MLTIKEYCLGIDKNKPDFLLELIDRKLVPEAINNEKKLTPPQLKLLKAEEQEFIKANYSTFDIVGRCMH